MVTLLWSEIATVDVPSDGTSQTDFHDRDETCVVHLDKQITLKKLEKINFVLSDKQKINDITFVEMTEASNLIVISIPSDIFTSFPNVEIFVLWQNIATISKEDFAGAQNLKKLYLSNNQLETLTSRIFSLAPNLTLINLFNKNIHTIDEYAFDGLNKL